MITSTLANVMTLISMTLSCIRADDQCVPHTQTFSLVQDRNGSNVCAPELNTAIIVMVGSRPE